MAIVPLLSNRAPRSRAVDAGAGDDVEPWINQYGAAAARGALMLLCAIW